MYLYPYRCDAGRREGEAECRNLSVALKAAQRARGQWTGRGYMHLVLVHTLWRQHAYMHTYRQVLNSSSGSTLQSSFIGALICCQLYMESLAPTHDALEHPPVTHHPPPRARSSVVSSNKRTKLD